MSEQGWQPIATAPRNEGVFFLAWDAAKGFYVAQFDYLFDGEVPKFSDHNWLRHHPTHWMPLPAAPVAA